MEAEPDYRLTVLPAPAPGQSCHRSRDDVSARQFDPSRTLGGLDHASITVVERYATGVPGTCAAYV
jgi:hypothetical protein